MNAPDGLQKIKPRNARSARALKAREPQLHENAKIPLFLHYTTCSQVLQLLMSDLHSLKKPLSLRFTKKNDIRPFEDAGSIEFFSLKNDISLALFGSHSKKRPHALTLIRLFEHKVLDMLELLVIPETMRTISQFKNKRKAAAGLKPMLCFSGTPFESPVANEYTLAKSLFMDLFRGPEMEQVDVEGLQYMLVFSAGEEVDGQQKPRIHLRSYMIRTRRSGQRLPRVEVEEMGPRADFAVGRMRAADADAMKEAMKKPKGLEPKNKKNITTDLIGDKMGRIHLGKQDLKSLQTRKMKGLKRDRGEAAANGVDEDTALGGLDDESELVAEPDVKRVRI